MSKKVLIVNGDPFFTDQMAEMLLSKTADIQIVTAANRTEATEILQGEETIDNVIMTLSIPRIADGYIFLAKVAGENFSSKKIIVLVQNLTEQVEKSVAMYGIEHLYTTAEMDMVAQKIYSSASVKQELPSFDVQKVQEALNEVMGPIGPFIFEKSYQFCDNASDVTFLIDRIIKEIGDKEQAGQFYRLCAI